MIFNPFVKGNFGKMLIEKEIKFKRILKWFENCKKKKIDLELFWDKFDKIFRKIEETSRKSSARFG